MRSRVREERTLAMGGGVFGANFEDRFGLLESSSYSIYKYFAQYIFCVVHIVQAGKGLSIYKSRTSLWKTVKTELNPCQGVTLTWVSTLGLPSKGIKYAPTATLFVVISKTGKYHFPVARVSEILSRD